MKPIRILAALLALAAPIAHAQDRCEFFSDLDQRGQKATFNVPESNSAGQPWASPSRRFEGAFTRKHAKSIHNNLESVRVIANDSDIAVYLYAGPLFNKRFQRLTVREGNTLRWNLGAMRNKTQSFKCIRDDFDAPQIPTKAIADILTSRIHDGVKSQASRFYDNRIDIRQGRLTWETGMELCNARKCVDHNNPDIRKYWDFLRYSYKGRGKLKADGRTYTMSIEIWIEPFLRNNSLRFRVDDWAVSVTKHIWHKRIRNGIEGELRGEIDGLGDMLDDAIRDTVRDQQGAVAAAALDALRAINLGYTCQASQDRFGYPNYNYSSAQLENICGGTAPDNVLAPAIRLHF